MSVLNQLLNRQTQQNKGVAPGEMNSGLPNVGVSPNPQDALLQKIALLGEVMKLKQPRQQPSGLPDMQMPSLPQLSSGGGGTPSAGGELNELLGAQFNQEKIAQIVKEQEAREKRAAAEQEKQQKMAIYTQKLSEVASRLGGKTPAITTFLNVGKEVGLSPVDIMPIYTEWTEGQKDLAEKQKKLAEAKAQERKNQPSPEDIAYTASFNRLQKGIGTEDDKRLVYGEGKQDKNTEKSNFLYGQLTSLLDQSRAGKDKFGTPLDMERINIDIRQTKYDIEDAENSGFDPDGVKNPQKLRSELSKRIQTLFPELNPDKVRNIVTNEMPNIEDMNGVNEYSLKLKAQIDKKLAEKEEAEAEQIRLDEEKLRIKAEKKEGARRQSLESTEAGGGAHFDFPKLLRHPMFQSIGKTSKKLRQKREAFVGN
jgi:hypothetical protein